MEAGIRFSAGTPPESWKRLALSAHCSSPGMRSSTRVRSLVPVQTLSEMSFFASRRANSSTAAYRQCYETERRGKTFRRSSFGETIVPNFICRHLDDRDLVVTHFPALEIKSTQ
jgi:hypothetical protein